MRWMSRRLVAGMVLVLLACPVAKAGGETAGWRPAEAARYLDEREKAWFGYSKCISCHSGLPYALARPALRKLETANTPAEPQSKLLAQIKVRIANWKKLDSKEFGLYYDSNEDLKRQSWGTEAVFNAAILAFDDQYEKRSSPTEATKQAFANLWQTQVQSGELKGSWEWLDFNEAPWGNQEARYFGAALAAIAIGTAPGYYKSGTDADTDAKVAQLRDYLKRRFPKEKLHNQAWALWASTKIDGILTASEKQQLIEQLLSKQQQDGGWGLLDLGPWVRNDRTPQVTTSDGYATALVLHVIQTAGVTKHDPKVARGLEWLRRHQSATGEFRSISVVKKRDPASHTGKFMSDAATAFAVLALSH